MYWYVKRRRPFLLDRTCSTASSVSGLVEHTHRVLRSLSQRLCVYKGELMKRILDTWADGGVWSVCVCGACGACVSVCGVWRGEEEVW